MTNFEASKLQKGRSGTFELGTELKKMQRNLFFESFFLRFCRVRKKKSVEDRAIIGNETLVLLNLVWKIIFPLRLSHHTTRRISVQKKKSPA